VVVHFMLDQRKPFGFPYLGKSSAIKKAEQGREESS
jgi:hypothetical protein